MNITIDIPDEYKDRNIYIFGGIELIAYQIRGGKLKIKTERCNLCGKCCQDVGRGFPFAKICGACAYPVAEPGPGDKKLCGLGGHRPFSCSAVDPIMLKRKGAEKFCSIRYKEAE